MGFTSEPQTKLELNHLFDIQSLQDLCSDDLGLLQEIIQELAQNLPRHLAAIQECLNEANTHGLSRHALHLRGTASVCRMYKVPRICRALEKAAIRRDLPTAKHYYLQLESQISSLVNFRQVVD